MKTKQKIILSGLLTIFSIFIFVPIYAQGTNTNAFDDARGNLNIIGNKTGFGETEAEGDLGVYAKIASVINILLGFAGIIATIFIIYAGIKWITAQGNDEQVSSAKNTIRDAIIGIVIIFTAYIIVNFVITNLVEIFATQAAT